MIVLLAQALLVGCDDPFDPFAPSDLAFSIFGRLEANADTQWIRIRALQASLTEIKQPLDAVVTLEEIATGTTVELRDSIFEFPSNDPDDDIRIWVHNFWTTMPIVPGRRYRLTATRSDGASSTATVHIPVMTNPSVVVEHSTNFSPPTRAYITGLGKVVMVYGDTRILPGCNYYAPIYREVFIARAWQTSGYQVDLAPDQAPPQRRMSPPGCPPELLGEKRIFVVTGQVEWGWPFDALVDARDLALPGSIGNVEGGVGFLGGTHQLVFPIGSCTPPAGTTKCTVNYPTDSPALSWRHNQQ